MGVALWKPGRGWRWEGAKLQRGEEAGISALEGEQRWRVGRLDLWTSGPKNTSVGWGDKGGCVRLGVRARRQKDYKETPQRF